MFCHHFLKIGLTVAVIAFLKYLFKDTSLIILAKWQATLADILTNFANSGPLASFAPSDY